MFLGKGKTRGGGEVNKEYLPYEPDQYMKFKFNDHLHGKQKETLQWVQASFHGEGLHFESLLVS